MGASRSRDSGGPPSPDGRSSGLSIDAEGRFLVYGEPVTHTRTLALLWRSLARLPDGSWQVCIGRESAPVAVDETPWAVRSAVVFGDRVELYLCDGSREALDPATLRLGEDGVLRCTLASGCAGRFTRPAQLSVGETMEEDVSAPAGFRLVLGARSWPIGAERR